MTSKNALRIEELANIEKRAIAEAKVAELLERIAVALESLAGSRGAEESKK